MASKDDVDISKVDLYDFLSLPAGPSSTPSEIKRAGRKTSLLYHPDKVAPTPENLQNFHLLQIAIAVLSDPAEKSKYDQTRESRLRRKAEVDALDERRRKMREDLEARENAGTNASPEIIKGQKRTYSQRELDIRRIADENRRKMEVLTAQRRAQQTEQHKVQNSTREKEDTRNGQDAELQKSEHQHEEIVGSHQSIKLRWIREGLLEHYDESSIQEIFSSGEIDHVVLLKDKKRKVEGRTKKVLMGTAVVGFASQAAAQAAMDKKATFTEFESIEWA